jgi:hypothetical protein
MNQILYLNNYMMNQIPEAIGSYLNMGKYSLDLKSLKTTVMTVVSSCHSDRAAHGHPTLVSINLNVY